MFNINELSPIFDHFVEGIYYVGKDRNMLYFNKAAEEITGFTQQEVLNSYCYDNILNHVTDAGKKLCLSGCPLHDTLKTQQVNQATVYLHHKQGHRVKVAVKTIPIMENGESIGAIELFTPIKKEGLLKNRIDFYKTTAMTDALTKAYNRRWIDDEFPAIIKKMNASIDCGVLFLDIDQFKTINDTFGHSDGDKVLKTIAKTISQSIRTTDTLIRYGGDEFVIVLFEVDQAALPIIAEKIRFMIENSHIRKKAYTLKFSVSIGATMFCPKESISVALKRADKAAYESKKAGRNRVTIV